LINGYPGNANLNTSNVSVTSILPSKNAAGALAIEANMGATLQNGTLVDSGALTADTYKELVSLQTSGWIRLCGVQTLDSTSRTIGLKIVIDGVTVFDETSAVITLSNRGFYAVGFAVSTSALVSAAYESFRFNKSLSILVKSSLSESDNVALRYLTAL